MAGGQRPRQKAPKQPPPITPQQLARLLRIKANTWSVYTDFKYGYRNKEDVSTLPPNVLVVGSQNVLTNAADRIASRQGYTLDGPAASNANIYPIDSFYDYQATSGTIQNLRKWNTNLEVRYVNPVTKAVSWINLLSNLNGSKKCRFTSFYDSATEAKEFCLFVNGDTNIYEWTGAIGSLASTSNATGIIATLNSSLFGAGGYGYVVGDVLTLAGGTGGTATVTAVTPGGVGTVSVAAGGSGYSVNDVLTLSAGYGTLQATVKVTSVGGGGTITGVSVNSNGNGYWANQTYTVTGGAGTNATITVNTVGNTVSGISLTTNGSGYSAATVATTGGTGTGCTVVIATVGNYSITISGTKTTNQLGFYNQSANAGKFNLLIDGKIVSYTTANGNAGMTFVGINVDPTTQGFAVGDAVIQQVAIGKTTTSSFLGAAFNIDLIGTLKNQVWYGSLTSNTVSVSKINNYQDVTSSTVRLVGEGVILQLDAAPVAFSPQGTQMYIAAGKDQWWVSYQQKTTLSISGVNTVTEFFGVERLKTTYNQGAQSQDVVSHFKNSIMYLSNEPIFNTLGLVKNIYADPQITNISDSIKYDMDAYDFTDATIFYFNYFIYFAVPKMGVVRMFNVQKKYWEAPQILPISGFYVVDGKLYGHSYLVPESYKMFTGYNDNGNPINCVAAFAYDNMSNVKHEALRPVKKNYNAFYTEGYLTSNTKLTVTWNYDFGGSTSQQSDTISGIDPKILFNSVGDGSLGKQPLGEYPIGSIFNAPSNIPKFRKISTMIRQNYYEYQAVFSSNDVDQQWEILAFGPAQVMASELPTDITE